MPNFIFCFPLPRKGILVILSLVVVVFQLVYFQNSLTIQWQRRESRAINYVSEILTSYLSKDSSSLEDREDLEDMDSLGMKIQEIEFVGNSWDKRGELEDLKNAIAKLKLHDGKKPEDDLDEVPNPSQDDFNKSSSIEQIKVVENEAKKPIVSTRLSKRTTKYNSKSFNTQKRKKKSHGFLNLHIWDYVCGEKTKSLKEFILFPSPPRYRFLVNKFKAEGTTMNDMGLRMFGFLHPKESGIYKFGISSAGTSELWLSNDTKSRNAKLVASVTPEKEKNTNYSGNFHKFAGQISKSFPLEKGRKYFVEVVYKHRTGSYGVEVAWMKPGRSDFQIISGRFLSLAMNDSQVPNNTVTVKD